MESKLTKKLDKKGLIRKMVENVCSACGQKRKRKMLMYTEDFKAYCASHWVCNDNHPNNPINKNSVVMYTFEELNVKAEETFTKKDFEVLQVLLNKPVSLRFQDFQTVTFLTKLQEEKGLKSLSEAIRYCIRLAMNEVDITIEVSTPKTEVKPKYVSTEEENEF